MEKLKMKTKNICLDNIEYISKKFPNAVKVTEKDGKIDKLIDFEVLRQELSSSLVEGNKEKYQISWPGKKQSILEANRPINLSLRPDKSKSVNFDSTKNIYIEGDNLDALKLLRETYLNKIKMIYIDPPYNTGEDYIYDDDFSETQKEYIKKSGDFDEFGKRLVKNLDSNGRFHSDWLSMMYPRLKVAKDLLANDGVIFISIDDTEQGNLRKICDEIFGETNFVSNIIWQKKFSRSNDATYFSTMHDHILCYCKANILLDSKGWKIGLLPREGEIPEGYSNPDNDPRGPWTSTIMSAKSGSDSLLYKIKTPSGRIVTPPSGRFWSCSEETFKKWEKENRVWFGKDGDAAPRKKTFLSEAQEGLRPNSILFQEEAGNNQEAKQEVKELFNDVGVFDGPKPVKLIKLLIKIANLQGDDIVLDFFSGSATTAHAVFEKNIEENTHLKFILIQMPEECKEKSEAKRVGYNYITEVGEDRIRKAGAKLKKEKKAVIDYGFRVFRVDSSNMKDIYYEPAKTNQSLLEDFANNIKEDRTPLDLLFQAMLECDTFVSSTIEEKIINSKKIFYVNNNSMIACFEKVDDEIITLIAKEKPAYVIFTNQSFKDDSTSINAEQIFKNISPSTIIKVL